jgi:hypothetical protein
MPVSWTVDCSHLELWADIDMEADGIVLPVKKEAIDFAVKYFAYLTEAAKKDQAVILPNPVRLMPGGLERIAHDGLLLQGSELLSQKDEHTRDEKYMRPISGEKLVYSLL